MIALVSLLLLVYRCTSMDIPQGSLYINNTGLLIEPEAFLVHYDQVKYISVGIKLGFHIIKNNDIRQCSANSSLGSLLNMSEKEVSSFMETIPTHFSGVSKGYCVDGLLDCYLDGKREKRSILAAGAILAGVTAAGIGLYNYISMSDIKSHLEKVDAHLEKLDHNFMSLDEYDHQYQEIETDVIRKIWHGEENLEQTLNKLGCEDLSGVVELNTKMHLLHYLDTSKNSVLRGIAGELTEFLLTPQYIKEKILKQQEYKDSLYIHDLGLFYKSSATFLTRYSKKDRSMFFLVATPVIKEGDISPLYRTTNTGHRVGQSVVSYNVPEFFHFLHNDNSHHVATPDLTRCRHNSGIYTCSTKDTTIGQEDQCLDSLIRGQEEYACKTYVTKKSYRCTYVQTRTGVLYRDCKQVEIFNKYGGITTTKNGSFRESGFLPYSNFTQVKFGNQVISSRLSTFKMRVLTIDNINRTNRIADLEQYMSDEVEHDLDHLDEMRKRDEMKFFLVTTTKHTPIIIGLLIFLIIVVMVFAIIYMKKAYKYKKIEERAVRYDARRARLNSSR